MEAFPMSNIRAETVADNILKGWISSFETPLVITTDQGKQFDAQLFQELSKLIGFKHNKTTTYPQTNGCIERWHHTLKASIMCHENESWTRSLPMILLGLRTIWRADFESTPAELLYGKSIRFPCDFFEDTQFQPQYEFIETLKASIKDFKPVPFSYHRKKKDFILKDLKDCSHVFFRTGSVRRRLKTKRGFVQSVPELKETLDLDFDPETLMSYLDLNIDKGFRICTELTQADSEKKNKIPQF
ncbi:integrase catalytic domain-containing protein [Trichonephila clavipes]|nr:integrase catalytic domain-containing protein [Trichonephila clavipes]